MSNPIDSLEQNNSISSLVFHWIAIFSDGNVIAQFNSDKSENKFELVKNNFDTLRYFNLINNNGTMFSVDLISGHIGYNDIIFPYRNLEKKESVRLIFFRRHKIEMNENFIEKSHQTIYHLGLQWNKNKINYKIILEINEDGSFIIGD